MYPKDFTKDTVAKDSSRQLSKNSLATTWISLKSLSNKMTSAKNERMPHMNLKSAAYKSRIPRKNPSDRGGEKEFDASQFCASARSKLDSATPWIQNSTMAEEVKVVKMPEPRSYLISAEMWRRFKIITDILLV